MDILMARVRPGMPVTPKAASAAGDTKGGQP